MADEPVQPPVAPPDAAPAPAPAEAPPPAAAPAEASPAPAAAPEAPPVVEAPVTEAPPAEPPADAAPPDPRRREPSLLHATETEEKPADAPPPDKPADAPADKPAEPPKEVAAPEGDKAPDAPPPDAPPAEPQRLEPFAEYKYDLPEQITMSDEQRGQFHTAIEDARNGNLQSLVDMHRDAMTRHVEAESRRQHEVWNQTLNEWREQTINDAEIGGQHWSGVERRVFALRDRVINSHYEQGTPEHKDALARFNHMLDSTGVGNHPEMWRFMNWLALELGEATAPTVLDPKPAPQPRGRGASVLHDHERSPQPNGSGRT